MGTLIPNFELRGSVSIQRQTAPRPMERRKKFRDHRRLRYLVLGWLCRMTYQMCLDVFWKLPPGRSEVENYAVAPGIAGIAMSAVKQPVIHGHRVSRSETEGRLVREVAHGDVLWRKTNRSLAMRLGKNGVNGRASEMRTWQHAKRAVMLGCLRHVAENRHLGSGSPVAYGMIPTPPVLVPP